ncbi:CocE/NonD family hydrolase [Pontivivens insulae]|uniref:Cocaine esterase n=1 Tax=Pontivivens insulae TaxID=1639689 RepID=A0A2R8A778_9RHOB|nr:CocE/NonD family hydrolase [Pontivivens insulae]RED18205.1 hypothetical protein DFR53_0400 [Pontivivens insulae]SPF28103.1 Cocaine esterase [Pontivivens insulae]
MSDDDEHDLRIPMRDGITLSARIWGMDPTNPKPAILEILPYRKRDGTAARDATMHPRFAALGYACLRVDLRGAGESEGLFDDEYSEQELTDIEDTITWISDQSWCTGKVGIQGISWGGFNGLQVAARRPRGLAAVITLCSTVDRFADDIHYKGGCMLAENLGWHATATSWLTMPPDPDLVADWRAIWLERLQTFPHLGAIWSRHQTRDAYWKHGSICEDFAAIEVPVLAIGGWHDGYRNTPAHLLAGLPGIAKAIIGPWNHKYPHIATPEPRLDYVAEAARWWDHWLKGEETGVADDPAARIYLMDGIAPATAYAHRPGRWVALQDWPAKEISQTALPLGADGLGEATPFSRVAKSVPRHGECCGEYFPFGFGPGELPDNQQEDDSRALCFDGPPLETPLAIVGAPTVEITLSADQPRAQLVARLCDVAPDGASTLISYGLLNLAFRNGFEVAEPLTTGQPVTVTLALDQCAYELAPGHCLRLALAPSYWPFAFPEPGNANLTVTAGILTVPCLDTSNIKTPEMQPNPPETAQTHTQLRKGTETKGWNTNESYRTLTIIADHGETQDLSHGLRNSSSVQERWSINPESTDDVKATIQWDRALSRGDITARTELETTLIADETHFRLSTSLRAFEGDTCLFERDWAEDIPRLGAPIS